VGYTNSCVDCIAEEAIDDYAQCNVEFA
jgi:hypothetical protein